MLPFATTGILFGLLYNTLFYPRTFVEYAEAGTIGLFLGVTVGLAEQTVLLGRLQGLAVGLSIAIRGFLYVAVVVVTLSLVLSIEPASLGQCAYVECVGAYVRGPDFLRDLGFSTLFLFPVVLTAQVVLLVGTRNFGRLLVGRYRKPRVLEATFMFVDLRGSTGLAEKLGHEAYSALLRDLFTDASHAVHRAKGEVYQFVGDEVVLVWPRSRVAARWLDCFVALRDLIEARRTVYERRYHTVPEFKAGVHSGEVVLTQVGALQRALVYHGDVLNTAARIQSKCNELGYDLLVSEVALGRMNDETRDLFRLVGDLPLRGKAEPVSVFGFKGAQRRTGRLAPEAAPAG
jgi:adenylate cyclase